MICPKCGRPLYEGERLCPACKSNRDWRWKTAIVIIGTILLVGTILFLTGCGDESKPTKEKPEQAKASSKFKDSTTWSKLCDVRQSADFCDTVHKMHCYLKVKEQWRGDDRCYVYKVLLKDQDGKVVKNCLDELRQGVATGSMVSVYQIPDIEDGEWHKYTIGAKQYGDYKVRVVWYEKGWKGS